MKKMMAGEIADAISGSLLTGDAETWIRGISTDSRALKPGMAFFPLIGDRFDGHDFMYDAIDAGASALICSQDPSPILSRAKSKEVVVIKVEDTLLALQDLSAHYLNQFPVRKIAVTGSTGKTTTKELLYLILSERYNTVRNRGNLNNLIGLPLSIFEVDETTEVAVFELGMDRIGEIRRLVEIFRPEIALITNVGHSHLERLGSRENILAAKMEIASLLGTGDSLVINTDNDLLSGFQSEGTYRVVRVGRSDHADIRIDSAESRGQDGIVFTLQSGVDIKDFTLSIAGLHNAVNSAMAVGAATCLGIDLETAAEGLKKATATDKRLNIKEIRGIRIIDDTYNASPDSMRAAIDVLNSSASGRKIAILGDMFELGPEEELYHREVGEYALKSGIDVVISVGKNARHISLGAEGGSTRAIHFDKQELLKEVLDQWIRTGDTVLVKGSRGMEMDRIVALLETGKK
jgi:UDP-N-acetylmuramoyl-tripeptide--D-alanyl-D-alanine ligase